MPEQLTRLSAVLRDTDKIERRELQKAMRRLARPLLKSARQGAIQILPHRGGLAERVATGRFTTQVKSPSKGAGVRVTARDRRGADVDRMDDGYVFHYVYGHRPARMQRITPGWFTKPLLLDTPKVRDEILRALDDTGQTMVRAV